MEAAQSKLTLVVESRTFQLSWLSFSLQGDLLLSTDSFCIRLWSCLVILQCIRAGVSLAAWHSRDFVCSCSMSLDILFPGKQGHNLENQCCKNGQGACGLRNYFPATELFILLLLWFVHLLVCMEHFQTLDSTHGLLSCKAGFSKEAHIIFRKVINQFFDPSVQGQTGSWHQHHISWGGMLLLKCNEYLFNREDCIDVTIFLVLFRTLNLALLFLFLKHFKTWVFFHCPTQAQFIGPFKVWPSNTISSSHWNLQSNPIGPPQCWN